MKRTAWLPALVLATVTLGVFGALHDYGPEGAVRRFHEAIRRNDAKELQEVLQEPIASTEAQQLVYSTRVLLRNGPAGLLGTRRGGRNVQMLVTYRDPYGRAFPIVFFVDKPVGSRQWKISASKTNVAISDYLRTLMNQPSAD
ncbi:MAG: hypothetical protein SFX74_11990 [Fimbriimonadaceae bacterium]|nr:hypothetical protein [Fimbriimonadaceae bacterium]